MENRKRIKLESITNVNNNFTNDSPLAANVFLTINDGSSTNTREFLTFDCHDFNEVKQEQNVICDGQTQALPVQYRMVNQQSEQHQEQMHQQHTPTKAISLLNTQSNIFPATMQLPSGCEIYLVNEYVESLDNDIDTEMVNTDMPYKRSVSGLTSIKLETNSSNTAIGKSVQSLPKQTTLPKLYDKTQTQTRTIDCQVNNDEDPIKRSFILEAYKKRDDKRRATHNEVERRRRDKINSWIFKLKELLPTSPNPNCSNNNNNNNISSYNNDTDNNCDNSEIARSSGLISKKLNSSSNQTQQRNINNPNRSPPIESKSQILIKACEYIKSMQDEVNSLRKCLKENECLRLNNRRLQQELNKLRCERKNNLLGNDNNTVRLLTSNSNNGNINTTISKFPTPKLMTRDNSTFSPYIKRELIITDYVD